jgi:hypothetical protein
MFEDKQPWTEYSVCRIGVRSLKGNKARRKVPFFVFEPLLGVWRNSPKQPPNGYAVIDTNLTKNEAYNPIKREETARSNGFVRLSVEEPPLFVWRDNPQERPEAREEVREHELAEFRRQQRQAARDAKVGPSSFRSFCDPSV